MYGKLKLIFALCCISHLAVSQSVISGKVVDKSSSEAVPFAHIYVPNTSYGSITDLYGNFTLRVNNSYTISEIRVSCLGFKTLSLKVEKSEQPILISLEEDVLKLDEVVITPETAENLLRKAFARINNNYDTAGLTFHGYYKMESKVDTARVRTIEAMLDIHKYTLESNVEYKALPSDSIYVDEIRAEVNSEIDFKLKAMVDWENTPYLLGYRDFVREFAYVSKSAERMLKRYNFEVENMINLQGRQTYVLTVTPKKGERQSYWNGKLFIDEETLAFAKIDVTSTPRMFKKLKTGLGYKMQSKINNVRYESGEWKESVNYKFKEGKWYFASVNSSKQFLLSSKKRGMTETPAISNIQYKTLDVTKDNPNSLENYLPQRKEGYWKVEEFMESKYDSVYWNQFDRSQLIGY